MNDIVGIGLLPVTEVIAFAIVYSGFFLSFGNHVASALAAIVLVEVVLVLLAILVKKFLWQPVGEDHSTPFWSWRHLTYYFAQDCFFAWCRRPLRVLTGTVLANVILRMMGCRIGKRTVLTAPLTAFDWNAMSFGDDCHFAASCSSTASRTCCSR